MTLGWTSHACKTRHLWQKAAQNKEEDDERGNCTRANTSCVEKKLTPSKKTEGKIKSGG